MSNSKTSKEKKRQIIEDFYYKNKRQFSLREVKYLTNNHSIFFLNLFNLIFNQKLYKLKNVLYPYGYEILKDVKNRICFYSGGSGLIVGHERFWIYSKKTKSWETFWWDSFKIEEIKTKNHKVDNKNLIILNKINDEIKLEETRKNEIIEKQNIKNKDILNSIDFEILRNSEKVIRIMFEGFGIKMNESLISKRIYDYKEDLYRRGEFVEGDKKENRFEIFEFFSKNIFWNIRERSKNKIILFNKMLGLFEDLSKSIRDYYVENKYHEIVEQDILNLLGNFQQFFKNTKKRYLDFSSFKFKEVTLLKWERSNLKYGGGFYDGKYIKSFRSDHQCQVYNLNEIQNQIDQYFDELDYLDDCLEILFFKVNLIVTILDKFKSEKDLKKYQIFKLDYENSGVFMSSFQTKLIQELRTMKKEFKVFQKQLFNYLQEQIFELKNLNYNVENLTNVMGESNENISKLLIDSNKTLGQLGLLSLVNTYQNYKTNKNTKPIK